MSEIPITQHGGEPISRVAGGSRLNDRRAPLERGVREAGLRREVEDTSWVSHHSDLQTRYKQAIARHVVTHFLDFGQVIQMGSGTTLNALMKEIIAFQKERQRPLDLTILTTNLEIVQMGKEAATSDPKIFGSTQVIITGGSLLASLNSLIGEYAASNVETEQIVPNYVFLGVEGIGFDPPAGQITYHFNQELTTQESYARRLAHHRVVVCDHTKIGKTTGWRARTDVKALLSRTEQCTILSSVPDKDDPECDAQMAKLKEHLSRFRNLVLAWRDACGQDRDIISEAARRTQLRLRLINSKGEVYRDSDIPGEILLWDANE